MTQTNSQTLPFPDYVAYRFQRDLGAAVSWFSMKWRESLLFKLGAFALACGAALWVAMWFWLASDLPEAKSLTQYQTPLPTMVRGIDGENRGALANQRRDPVLDPRALRP